MLPVVSHLAEGSDPKLQHPVSLWRFPTELAAKIPGDSLPARLPAYFCPIQHMHRKQAPHTTLKIAGMTLSDFAATNTTLCVAKFITALCHSICVFPYSLVSLPSLFCSVCVCVCLHCSLSVPFLPVKVPRLPRLICGPFVSHGSGKGLLT